MSRLEYNRVIIHKLTEWVERCPTLRFGQLLWHLNILCADSDGDIKDPFYEESEDILQRLSKREEMINTCIQQNEEHSSST